VNVPPTEFVRAEWLRRVEAEYRSAVITQHLTLWLMEAGASPDLLHAGLRIAGDELVHAELSLEAYRAAGGQEGPRLARETLGLVRRPEVPLEHDIARVGVDVFCLGETVAVPLFKHLRDGCRVPAARRALDRILRDEVRHRDFGWMLLEWLLALPQGAELRAMVARELSLYFARLRGAYGQGAGAAARPLDDTERAWGLMPAAQYAEVLTRTLERDWTPRFARLGLDARAAWERR
jgi:hypothetical protein